MFLCAGYQTFPGYRAEQTDALGSAHFSYCMYLRTCVREYLSVCERVRVCVIMIKLMIISKAQILH